MTEIAESGTLSPLEAPSFPRPWQEYLSPAQASGLMGLSEQWLAARRSYGGGPRLSRAGRRVLYNVADLRNYLAARAVETTAAADRLAPLPPTTPLHKRPGAAPSRTGRPPNGEDLRRNEKPASAV